MAFILHLLQPLPLVPLQQLVHPSSHHASLEFWAGRNGKQHQHLFLWW
jgi:hypothetical protein